MPSLILWIRYMLILAPASITMLISERITSQGLYTSLILSLLLLAQIRHKWMKGKYQQAVFFLELAFVYVLNEQYDGVLYILFVSALISFFSKTSRSEQLAWTAVVLIVMNAAIMERGIPIIAPANLLILTVAGLLLQIRTSQDSHLEVDALYDKLRLQHYEADNARNTIMEYARQVGDIALVEERNRIARELHDELGHKLIRLKMMLEAAVQILPSRQDKGMELVRSVRDQLADSMESLRQTVRKMKPDDSVIRTYSLEKLASEFAVSSGIQVRYATEGVPTPLYPSEEFVLYRNAQEALTNAARHGQATGIDVVLQFQPESIRLIVSNNGLLPETNLESKGLGLSGMEERVRLIGGFVDIDYSEKFTVTTVLPRR